MFSLIFQTLVLIPLISYISKEKFGFNKGAKLAASAALLGVFMLVSFAIEDMRDNKDNIYQILDIRRDAPKSTYKKAFREASLKYHPDKNKDPKALEIQLQLNDYIEILKDEEAKQMYDYFQLKEFDKVEKPTAMGHSQEEHDMMVAFRNFMYCIGSVPFYIVWTFIPMAILDKKKKKTKLTLFAICAAMAAIEIGFLTGKLPKEISGIIITFTPPKWTYKEFFSVIKTVFPYLLSMVIAYFDIFVYKTFEENNSDEDKLKNNIKDQIKICEKIIENQNKLIEFISKVTGKFSSQVKKQIIDKNTRIYKQIKQISNVEKDNEQMENKWTFGKVIGLCVFLFFLYSSMMK